MYKNSSSLSEQLSSSVDLRDVVSSILIFEKLIESSLNYRVGKNHILNQINS